MEAAPVPVVSAVVVGHGVLNVPTEYACALVGPVLGVDAKPLNEVIGNEPEIGLDDEGGCCAVIGLIGIGTSCAAVCSVVVAAAS